MSEIVKGAAALGGLEDNGGDSSSEFTKLPSGTTLKIRAKGTEDIMQYYGYGVFKSAINGEKVHTFIPKNPPTRNKKGFPESNLTAWDQASEYYRELKQKADDEGDEEKADEYKTLAGQFRGKEKYVLGFTDLDTGQDIVIDFTRNQAQTIYGTIKKYAKKLDKLAFELSKTGKRQDTKVALMPMIDMDEDLDDKQRANFDKTTGKDFDAKLFDGLLYEMEDAEQIESLTKAGFDVSQIGLDAPKAGDSGNGDDAPDPTKQF
jgi:hypothetical protein